MGQILIPSMDPRHERRTGSAEGLARRVAELERRLGKYEASPFVPSITLTGQGTTYSTASPPNATSGTAFTVPASGRYLCRTDATTYATAVGWSYLDIFISNAGSTVYMTNCELFSNQTGIHQTLHSRWHHANLQAGTAYHWQKLVGSVTGDANDRWSFVAVRVGAL